MRGRLITTIIGTIAEEAATLLLGVWLLPKAGVNIPLPVLIAIMAVWLAWSVFTYQKGTHALNRKPVNGLAGMTGMSGVTVKALHPDGMVKISGELWAGHSVHGRIEVGARVVVVSQDRLKLSVRLADSSDSPRPVQKREH